jgi:3'(2'), 5'-bisphosphate nucleotidase
MVKQNDSFSSALLSEVAVLIKKAGSRILYIYNSDNFETRLKEDLSPLTAADSASHVLITEGLKKLKAGVPVLSEESQTVPYDVRKEWDEYWLVDPLDGTKEFIKRNGEFTVNIALIKKNIPVMGFVYAPVLDLSYFAQEGKGAYKKSKEGPIQKIAVRHDFQQGIKAVASRSHESRESGFFDNLGVREYVRMGSSLKFCLVAEGLAHLYPRFLPTMEWDTAAAHCVAQEAGAEVTDLSGKPLQYNKKDLLNPSFIVSSIPRENWQKALLA